MESFEHLAQMLLRNPKTGVAHRQLHPRSVVVGSYQHGCRAMFRGVVDEYPDDAFQSLWVADGHCRSGRLSGNVHADSLGTTSRIQCELGQINGHGSQFLAGVAACEHQQVVHQRRHSISLCPNVFDRLRAIGVGGVRSLGEETRIRPNGRERTPQLVGRVRNETSLTFEVLCKAAS